MPDPIVRDHRNGSGGPGIVYQPGSDGNVVDLGGNSFKVYGQTFIWNRDGSYTVNGHRMYSDQVDQYIAQQKSTYDQAHPSGTGTPGPSPTPDVGGVRGDPKTGFKENANPGTVGAQTDPNAPPPGAAGSAFQVPGFDELNKKYNDQYNKISGQQAYQANNTVLGPVANAQGSTLGPAAQAQAQQANAAQVGPMAQAQNSDLRAQQLAGIAYQNDLMQGKNSVAGLLGQQQQQALISQQHAAALSGRPGQQGMMARLAAQNSGSIGTNMAYQTQVAQQAERNAAAQNFGQFTGQARGQDQDISMFNAGQSNQGSLLQAQLSNQANLTNAQLGTSTNQYNTGAQNERTYQQGNLSQQNKQFNTGQANDFTRQQGTMNQQTSLANVASQNTNAWNQVQSANNNLNSQANLAGAQQTGSIEQQKLAQQANQAQAQLQNNLDMIAAQKPELWQRLMSIGATSIPAIIQIMKGGGQKAQDLGGMLKGTALDFGTDGGGGGGNSAWAGALGGAAAGASAGAMFGPWGAAIGGAAGALLSFF